MSDPAEPAKIQKNVGQAVLDARLAVRPMAFRTGIPDVPVSSIGSCFIAQYRGKLYVVTAAHVVRDGPTPTILVTASTGKSNGLSLARRFTPEGADAGEYDLCVFEVASDGVTPDMLSGGRAINFDHAESYSWHNTGYTSSFVVCGWSEERSPGMDFESWVMQTHQIAFWGRYQGCGNPPNTHLLRVEDGHGFNSFSGVSGGAVFSLTRRLAAPPLLRFAGMPFRGSAQGGIVQFIDAESVASSLEDARRVAEFRPLRI